MSSAVKKKPKEGKEDLKIVSPRRRHDRFVYSEDRDPSRRLIVSLYARLGLHHFNFLRGKDLRLTRITQFTKTFHSAYKITFYTKDPPAQETLAKETLFRAQVDEFTFGGFVLVSKSPGPYHVKTKRLLEGDVLCGKQLSHFMPTLPPEDNPFQDDTGRFHLLKKSEVLKNEWLRLYLELAVATTKRHHVKYGVANLKILRVAMESTRDLRPFHKGLGAYDAIFYIRYKDTCKARAGDHVERVAIIRRIVDVHSGIFRIIGRTQSFQTITPPPASDGIAAMEASAQD